MIGFNGGLIGQTRTSMSSASNPGVWTTQEQVRAIRDGFWPGTALLDIYPGATAAYSLRNLRGARLNNPVIRVRRSNDNTEQDFTAGQITDGSLITFCGVNSGFVTTWYDQSTALNNAVQTSTSIQPRIVNAGVLETDSGLPAITWGLGSGMHMAPASAIALNAGGSPAPAFFCVTRHTNAASNWSWIIGENSGNFFIGKRTSSGTAHINLVGDLPVTINQRAVSYWQLGAGISQWTVNATTGTLSDWTSTSSWRIGNRGPVIDEIWIGFISEIIYYPTTRVSTKTAIINVINSYYSIY
jgi:hypothetical protein